MESKEKNQLQVAKKWSMLYKRTSKI
jgi:hypothetical protein